MPADFVGWGGLPTPAYSGAARSLQRPGSDPRSGGRDPVCVGPWSAAWLLSGQLAREEKWGTEGNGKGDLLATSEIRVCGRTLACAGGGVLSPGWA
ncbi:hypothetical protein NDU88_005438 [Pleurodeles waltl]|uniref:Uncharacterized protein n=1 Tax=Pleurodeles waltl TaxID=8319 RepID=A0AAV7MYD7_PLEWA|nr:hypothetical protein NDU88_005438 [Pleurodeles waltl]